MYICNKKFLMYFIMFTPEANLRGETLLEAQERRVEVGGGFVPQHQLKIAIIAFHQIANCMLADLVPGVRKKTPIKHSTAHSPYN